MWDGPQKLVGMPHCRIVVLRPDETVAEVRQIVARNDHEAMVYAKAIGGNNAVELWGGLCFIEHFQVRLGL